MDYMSVSQAAAKWGVSARRVHKLLEEKRDGALRFGQAVMIPKATEKPADARKTRYKKEGGGDER